MPCPGPGFPPSHHDSLGAGPRPPIRTAGASLLRSVPTSARRQGFAWPTEAWSGPKPLCQDVPRGARINAAN
eukprot:2710083-Alexandrium_andersonii.AAC.1